MTRALFRPNKKVKGSLSKAYLVRLAKMRTFYFTRSNDHVLYVIFQTLSMDPKMTLKVGRKSSRRSEPFFKKSTQRRPKKTSCKLVEFNAVVKSQINLA